MSTRELRPGPSSHPPRYPRRTLSTSRNHGLPAALTLLRRELLRTLGRQRARRFLLRYGWLLGYAEAAEDVSALGSSADLPTRLSAWLLRWNPHGSRIRPFALGAEEAALEVVLEHSTEAQDHLQSTSFVDAAERARADQPACWMTAGLLGGYVSACVGRIIVFREVQCRSQGHPACHLVSCVARDLEDASELLHGWRGAPGWAEMPTFDELEAQRRHWERARAAVRATLDALATAGLGAGVAALAKSLEATVCVFDPLAIERLRAPEGTPTLPAPAHLAKLVQAAKHRWEASGLPEAEPSPEPIPGARTLQALVLPLADRHGLHGFLTVVRGGFHPWDDHVCQVASRAMAIELGKEKATAAVKVELEGGLLRDLLSGRFGSEEEVCARASYLGVTLTAPMRIAIVRAPGNPARVGRAAPGLCEDLRGSFGQLLWVVEGNQLVMLLPWSAAPRASALLETLEHALAHHLGPDRLVGLSEPCHSPAAYRQRFQETQEVLEFLAQAQPPGRIIELDQLGVYRVLFRLQNRAELQSYALNALKPILEYDQKRGAGLLHTLEVYLEHGGSLKQTAARCHLHINGLKYRLRRIAELGGVDLENPRTRLSLQVALAVYRLTRQQAPA